MILAAAACAEQEGPPPPELKLAWQARTWGTLPEPGGLRDQRAGELDRMSAALNTYETIRGFFSSNDWEQWGRTNPGGSAILAYVLRLRREHGEQSN